MNSRTFFAAAAVLSVIVLAALSAALPSALLPGNTAYAQTNSAPQFPSSETGARTVDENTPWYQNIGDPVVATDPDDDKLTYSLENARTSPFTIDRFTGQLQTGAPLDYETQATYTVKVIATDTSDAKDTIAVTITVTNVEEDGKVSLTWTRLQVGAEVEASLTDPDGNVSGVTWHWEKSSDKSSWTAISTATQAAHTPVEGDVNRYLRAGASYTDPLGAGKTAWSAAASVKAVPDPNQTPDFRANTGGGYDCPQGEPADVCLYVKRHAPPGSEIHYPGYVHITDNDQVRYTIGGADAAKFRIGPLSGDLYTTDAHAYDNPGTDGKFEITLTAADPSGQSDSIDVALSPSGSAGSPTVRGPEEIRYPENGTWPLATYSATASSPDRDIHGWMISVEPGGGGGDLFDIDDDGVLTFTQPPDYEDPADENGDNRYSFTIMAYDTNPPSGRRPGRTLSSVRVTVADVNEPPEFSVETASRTIAENTTTGVAIGAPVTATDPDTGDTPAYTLGGTDANFFDIDASSGQLQTKAALDHETKSSYTVTVAASDGALTATVDVTVTVTNIDEAGTVALSTDQPAARAEITAALTDPDEGVTGAVWQWERSSDGNTDWAGIGTSSPSYTPVDGDVGYHLRATASYTDGHGPGKTAQAASTQAVQAGANRPPEFDSATAAREVPENTEAGENIGAPVTATDPDTGDTPAYTLGGTDANIFDIDASSGQLRTKAALDYEVKNSYTVTVTASDGALTATVDVTVTVTNIDEAGTVTLSTNQPPARAEITAALTDPDEGVSGAVWQWERSSDGNTGWAGIGTSSPSYTPVDGDVGYHLRATASYTDGHGPGKTAQAASTQAVQAGANRPPEFDSATAAREVPENTEAGENIGAPVTATDPDTGDTPAYTLEGPDADSFDIGSASGQIQTKSGVTYDHETKSSYSVTVKADDNNGGTAAIDVAITVADVDEPPEFDSATAAREVPENTEAGENIGAPVTAADPDTGNTPAYTLEGPDADSFDIGSASGQIQTKSGVTYDHETKSSYSVTVKADDNNGGTAAIDVTITVADVNEPPEFDSATAAREVPENTEAGENIGAPVTAADPDTGNTQTYTLEGADADSFDIDSASGQIQTKSGVTYDHESKSSYSVTVKADDNNGGTATIDVTITVADVDEAGTVTLSTDQPPARAEITAALTDPDEGVTGAVWQWERSSDGNTGWAGIGTGSPSYTPVDGDVGYHLRATASYTDGHGPGKTAQAASTQAVQAGANRPPEFDSATAAREVPENTEAGENIGAPVTAADPDTGDTPAYTLEGADADSFDIDSASGQIQTKSGVTYDHESKSSYSVTVKADDNNGGTATIDVTITVADVDEAGTVTLSTDQPPARAEITAALTDPDEGVSGAVWQWERSSDGNTGWAGIGTGSPSYTPVDGDVGYHLRATASYSDGHGPGKTAQAVSTQAVQAGANRPPEFDSATAAREVPENTEAGGNIGAPVTAADPDTGNTQTYTLEGADADSFDIDSASGQIQTKSGVTYDHETKSSYSVTVKADDNNGGTATIDVTITVADVDEAGTVALSTDQPAARAEITAALADPDEGVTGAVWQWERSSDGNTGWAGIGTGSPSYTPVDGDVGYHLRATASYTDGHGPGKTAQAASTQAVQAGANRPPEFDSATAAREVPENTEAGENIGAPVTANDPDTGNTPAYALEGADADSFDIDSASGQIQTKSGVTYDHETKSSYSVTVKADDNNGGTATIDVTITVADVAEPPEFDSATAAREVPENTEAGVAIGAPVTAADPDTGDTPAYTLGGTDAAFFDIGTSTGQLQTKAALDHEVKNSYTVTVTASDGALTAAVDVTVTVTNIDEAGTVTLSTDQPPARAEITAALTDPDEGVTGAVWQWERSSDGNTGWAGIGTGSPSYTPVDGDVGYHLRATASYTDGHGPGKTAQAVSTQAVQAGANRPPEFDSATAAREVPENTEAGENIGAPVTATDPDTGNTQTYTLEGADADSFDIDSASGQIQTKSGVTYDHESKSSYSVTVKADDNNGGTAAIDVTITVADVDEAGTVTLSTDQPPARAEITAALTDPDEGVTGAVWQWERSSDGNTGWAGIGTGSPSYTPVDGDVGYHLRATASYTDGHGPGKTAQAVSTQAVQAGANRPPEFDSATAAREVPENTEAGENIGAPVTAADPDDDTLTYTLGGADADSFDIGRSTGQITVGAETALDYEARASYTVSVTAADPSGSSAAIVVTIAVFAEDLGELGSRYDTDNDKVIGKDEALEAIIDYFADQITRDELLGVITLYLTS